jgi:DNA-binding NtrC family response regulator
MRHRTLPVHIIAKQRVTRRSPVCTISLGRFAFTVSGLRRYESWASDVNKDVLLVELDRGRLHVLQRILAFRARVDPCADFVGARARLLARPPDLLVTNSRLGAYNGLHLAYLAAAAVLPTRVVVYGDADCVSLARETQIAGAFYVADQHIAAALPAYLAADLPPQDRRDAEQADRRQQLRGGRRATDSEAHLIS